MNKPGPGKFRIRWSGPYEITEIHGNNTVDVSTLQGESLGRVNMSKIKPYHELLEAKAYVLEDGDTTSSTSKETKQQLSHHTNHPNTDSNYLKPCELYKGQRVIITSPEYDEIHHKMIECYSVQPMEMKAHDKSTTKTKSRAMIRNYLIQPLPKGTTNMRSANGIQLKETKDPI